MSKEFWELAIKRKSLLIDYDDSNFPSFLAATIYPTSQRALSGKDRVKGIIFLETYYVRIPPDYHTSFPYHFIEGKIEGDRSPWRIGKVRIWDVGEFPSDDIHKLDWADWEEYKKDERVSKKLNDPNTAIRILFHAGYLPDMKFLKKVLKA